MSDEDKDKLYETHTGKQEHYFKSSYTKLGSGERAFVGIECECEGFIPSTKLAGIVNHYQGNRIVPSVVIAETEKGKRI